MKIDPNHEHRVLIVGAAGFVGGYLAETIHTNTKWQICATKMRGQTIDLPYVDAVDVDIVQPEEMEQLVMDQKPDLVFHLAAQSSVAASWMAPGQTVDINIKGTLNLLDSIRIANCSPKVMLIGSGEEYGAVAPEDIPVKENTCPRPGNIYAVTKNAQNQIGAVYAKAYKMDIVSTRSFNHMGPGQSPIFVVADFCRQVARIEAGLEEPSIYVGNLTAKRDFTDVRDVVEAYVLLAQHSQAGQTYNVGSGRAVSIQSILDIILDLARKPITVEVDQGKFRPVDVPIVEADIAKLQAATGWAPRCSLEQTLQETLDYWRGQVK